MRVLRVHEAAQDAAFTDEEDPTPPTNLTVVQQGKKKVRLTWDPATDNAGVKGYLVFRDGTLIALTDKTSLNNRRLTPGGTYTYTVKAYDYGYPPGVGISTAGNAVQITLVP